MDEQELKRLASRLRQVNDVLTDLDPEIRGEAFALLKDYVTASQGEEAEEKPRTRSQTKVNGDPAAGEELLIEKHLSDADHENALLALAILYQRHGRGPYQQRDVSAVADQYKLNMPKRLDMFFRNATRGDPPTQVIRKQADGWKITPGGETWIKQEYGVNKGRSPLRKEDESS